MLRANQEWCQSFNLFTKAKLSTEADTNKKPDVKGNSKAQSATLAGSTPPPGKPTQGKGLPAAVENIGIQSSTKAKQKPDEKPPPVTSKIRKSPSTIRLGPDDKIGSGDSRIIYGALSSPLVDNAFELLKEEVDWETMHHRSGKVPRLVAVQGEVGEADGIPIYRHPADESPRFRTFIPTVEDIRDQIEGLLHQPFNHALIQLYRDGIDNISEHSDKVCSLLHPYLAYHPDR